MLCANCGTWVDEHQIVCPSCGKMLPRGENRDEGLQAMRQGKRARMEAAAGQQPAISQSRQGSSRVTRSSRLHPSAGQEVRVYGDTEIFDRDGQPLQNEDTGFQRTIYRNADTQQLGSVAYHGQDINTKKHKKRRHPYEVKQHMVNWVAVTIAAFLLVVALAGGFVFYLRNTDSGQKLMARWGRDASSAALWEVGKEQYDVGNISEAISLFERALQQDEEAENLNVTWMMTLGETYESAGMLYEAEALYVRIYTEIVPSSRDAYASEIRILLQTDRAPEAAELMDKAYEMTGMESFRAQRAELLPIAPSVGKTAGNYEEAQNLVLSSSQGYDVYYTFDDNAVLPQDGIQYTEPVRIDEGIWKLRAVAVNGKLVSDELRGTYRVVLPSPGTPGCNLAPNTYQKRQRVKLRISLDDEEKIKQFKKAKIQDTREIDITIFYTIDGSIPDEDSPVWDGETAIQLPGGYVTLRATAVNGYGKASNTLEVLYKIEQKPWPEASFNADDQIKGVDLMVTTQEAFQNHHGQPGSIENVENPIYDGATVKCLYPWGYAVFTKTAGDMYLAELFFNTTGAFVGPRGTNIGDTEAKVVGSFRDMGQVESPSGNRGLYKNDTGIAKIYAQENGTKLIRYTAYTANNHNLRLEYSVSSGGTVNGIDYLYIP